MYFDNPNPSRSCDQYPLAGNLDSPYEDPRPILTAAKRTPDIIKIIPEVIIPEECTSGEIFKQVCYESGVSFQRLASDHIEEVAFNIYEPLVATNGPSGTFNAFNLNTFFNPDPFNFKNPILQAKGKITDPVQWLDGSDEESFLQIVLLCVKKCQVMRSGSRVVMIASTRPETCLNLSHRNPEKKITTNKFYINLVKRRCNRRRCSLSNWWLDR